MRQEKMKGNEGEKKFGQKAKSGEEKNMNRKIILLKSFGKVDGVKLVKHKDEIRTKKWRENFR